MFLFAQDCPAIAPHFSVTAIHSSDRAKFEFDDGELTKSTAWDRSQLHGTEVNCMRQKSSVIRFQLKILFSLPVGA